MMKTKTKLKRENRKIQNENEKIEKENENAKTTNLSLNESASIQYGTYGCYGRTALNP